MADLIWSQDSHMLHRSRRCRWLAVAAILATPTMLGACRAERRPEGFVPPTRLLLTLETFDPARDVSLHIGESGRVLVHAWRGSSKWWMGSVTARQEHNGRTRLRIHLTQFDESRYEHGQLQSVVRTPIDYECLLDGDESGRFRLHWTRADITTPIHPLDWARGTTNWKLVAIARQSARQSVRFLERRDPAEAD